MSLKAAAEYLDVSQKSVRNWIAQGRITGYRVGRPPRRASPLDTLPRSSRPRTRRAAPRSIRLSRLIAPICAYSSAFPACQHFTCREDQLVCC
ncbi:helix-turn-helix domain-containing protein [Thermocrispum municipale]|uniref:helix-turn-helix domain-containing protein n=1 Tax=Thermocrispum municipale TaxID=37926 RepID=UPI003CCBAA87